MPSRHLYPSSKPLLDKTELLIVALIYLARVLAVPNANCPRSSKYRGHHHRMTLPLGLMWNPGRLHRACQTLCGAPSKLMTMKVKTKQLRNQNPNPTATPWPHPCQAVTMRQMQSKTYRAHRWFRDDGEGEKHQRRRVHKQTIQVR